MAGIDVAGVVERLAGLQPLRLLGVELLFQLEEFYPVYPEDREFNQRLERDLEKAAAEISGHVKRMEGINARCQSLKPIPAGEVPQGF